MEEFDDVVTVAMNPELTQLLLRLVLTIAVVFAIARVFYYPKSKRKDYFFTFVMISISIYLMIFLLGSVKLKVGFALGLFAIFGIIRYRTESMPVREMTYLFVIIAISVINALAEFSFLGLAAIDVLFMLCLWVCEGGLLLRLEHVSCKLVLYDRLDLILPERYDEMVEDLKKRTGLDILRVEVGHIDFIRDSAMLRVHYRPSDNEVNVIDTLVKFPREER